MQFQNPDQKTFLRAAGDPVSCCGLTLGRAMEDDGEMVVQVAMEMSLDEWKALQETSRPKPEFNIRKAENKIPSKAKVIHQSRHLEVSL